MKIRFTLISIFMIALSILLFAAYSQKTTIVLLDSGKSHNAIIVANKTGQTRLDKVRSYVKLKDKQTAASPIKTMTKEEVKNMFSKALASEPSKPITYIVYFKQGSTELTEASKQEFQKALKTIEKRSPCMVDIIGHTDTVGASSLNTKVSLKRAGVIKQLVEESQIKILSLVAKGYGEEDLLVKTKDNKAEAKNRNVEIFIK